MKTAITRDADATASARDTKPWDKVLTPRQARFVEEYLKDLNGTQAAIRAGYSAKTANEQAAQNLAKLSIQQAVASAMAARSARTRVSQDRVLNELARMAFISVGCLFKNGSLLKIEQLEEDDRAGIVSLKVVTKNKGEGEVEYVAEVRTDKLGALTLLARHLGIDKLTVADDRLDLTKLSTETLDRIKTELGL